LKILKFSPTRNFDFSKTLVGIGVEAVFCFSLRSNLGGEKGKEAKELPKESGPDGLCLSCGSLYAPPFRTFHGTSSFFVRGSIRNALTKSQMATIVDAVAIIKLSFISMSPP